MQYRTLLFALCCFLLLGPACDESPEERPAEPEQAEQPEQLEAPTDQSDETAAEPSGDIERSLMWRIDAPNGPVWLFGTIHGGVDASSIDELPLDLQQALDAAEVVALEVSMDAFESPEVMQRMMLPGDESLSSLLEEEQWETFKELSPLPTAHIEQLEPWIAYSIITYSLLGDEEAVDASLKNYARREGKSLTYFETAEQQLDYLSEAITVDLLGDFLDDVDGHQQRLDKLVDAYKTGDLDVLEDVVFDQEQIDKHPQFYDLLIDERNDNWLPQILEHIEQGNVFIAVGAGHLIGDKGLINMLTEEGHDPKRVAPKN